MANRSASLDAHVFTIEDLKLQANRRVPMLTSGGVDQYFNSGAGDMLTLRDNEQAFDRYKLRPRVLRNVENVDTACTIFDCKVNLPLGLAPTAAHRLAHQDGELGTSRAAASRNIPLVLSSWSTTSIEDVKTAGGDNPYAMQVTFLRDRSVTERIIRRAEKAGYKALFVSADLPVLGNRVNERRNEFAFPVELGFPNLALDGTREAKTDDLDYDSRITWDECIPWLRSVTKLEIWLKGVYTPEDVTLAIDAGVDGVIISNHGGRQLDGVPATLDALRECAPVARGKIKLALDGGIRRGSDVFKAIALGADFCFVGRIAIWGLAYKGTAGVELAIDILADEFRRTMMLTGCKTLEDIKSSHLSVLSSDGILAKL